MESKKSCKNKWLIIVIPLLIILIYTLALNISKQLERQKVINTYPSVSYESEEEMIAAITGTWVQQSTTTEANIDNYITFENGVCTAWKEDGIYSTENYTLSYEDGKIIFDVDSYYQTVYYKNETYILLTPKAKKIEYAIIFKKTE